MALVLDVSNHHAISHDARRHGVKKTLNLIQEAYLQLLPLFEVKLDDFPQNSARQAIIRLQNLFVNVKCFSVFRVPVQEQIVETILCGSG